MPTRNRREYTSKKVAVGATTDESLNSLLSFEPVAEDGKAHFSANERQRTERVKPGPMGIGVLDNSSASFWPPVPGRHNGTDRRVSVLSATGSVLQWRAPITVSAEYKSRNGTS